MEQGHPRRQSKQRACAHPVGISTDHFAPLVQEALKAFGTDLRYGI